MTAATETTKRPVDVRQIRFKAENADWLRAAAAAQERSVNWLVNRAVEMMIAAQEKLDSDGQV